MDEAAGGFVHLSEKTVADAWRIRLVEARFRGPDGAEFERFVVRHPGAVAVVAITDDDQVLMVRQYRAPMDASVLEIPAGTRDVDGEPPELTARRELAEEVGMEADNIVLLAEILNTPGFCDERTAIYMATGLRAIPVDPCGVEEEHMEQVSVPLAEFDGLVASGQLIDAQSILGVMMARDRLRRQPLRF